MGLRARYDLFPAPNNCPESHQEKQPAGSIAHESCGGGTGVGAFHIWGNSFHYPHDACFEIVFDVLWNNAKYFSKSQRWLQITGVGLSLGSTRVTAALPRERTGPWGKTPPSSPLKDIWFPSSSWDRSQVLWTPGPRAWWSKRSYACWKQKGRPARRGWPWASQLERWWMWGKRPQWPEAQAGSLEHLRAGSSQFYWGGE